MARVAPRASRIVIWVLPLAACASSAAKDDVPDLLDASSQVDPATDDDLPPRVKPQIDAGLGTPPSDSEGPRDAGPRDAGSTDRVESDAGMLPGTSVDAGSVATDAGSSMPPVAVPDSGPPAPTCTAPTSLCGSTCVDLSSDANHCSACGMSCGGGACTMGACAKAPPAGCTPKTYGGHSYFFCSVPLDWISARALCLREGLDLTVINDAAENDFVRTAGTGWIGASDIDGETKWRALGPGMQDRASGPLVTYENWAQGEPNNTLWCAGIAAIGDNCLLATSVKTDEDCALLDPDGRWDDKQCPLPNRFVCESY